MIRTGGFKKLQFSENTRFLFSSFNNLKTIIFHRLSHWHTFSHSFYISREHLHLEGIFYCGFSAASCNLKFYSVQVFKKINSGKKRIYFSYSSIVTEIKCLMASLFLQMLYEIRQLKIYFIFSKHVKWLQYVRLLLWNWLWYQKWKIRISGRRKAVVARETFIYKRYSLHVNSLKKEK